jgi:WD40 repeat protein
MWSLYLVPPKDDRKVVTLWIVGFSRSDLLTLIFASRYLSQDQHMKRQRTNTPNILDSSRLPPNNPAAVRQQRRSILLDSNHGYTYSTWAHSFSLTDRVKLWRIDPNAPCSKLQGHDGCVNAIEYSAGDGRFLASAGDDSEVLVWDLHSDLTSPEALRIPSAKFVGHRVRPELYLRSDRTPACLSWLDLLVMFASG